VEEVSREAKAKQQKNKAIVHMLISSFGFAVMGVAVKMAVDVPVYEKVFFRNLFTVFFAYYLVKKNGASLLGSKEGRPLLLMRSIAGMLGVLTMFYALTKIDVATASTIQKISQFWVLILAGVFLNEKVHPRQYLYLILALVGVFVVSKPSAPDVLIPTMICFASSIFAGIAYIFVSKLKNYEKPPTVVFFFSLFSTVVMFIPTLLQFKWLTLEEWGIMILMGTGAMCGQIFLTSAYHYAAASEVSIYAYANIIFSAIIAFMLWGTFPDTLSLLGILLIVLASVFNFQESRRATQ